MPLTDPHQAKADRLRRRVLAGPAELPPEHRAAAAANHAVIDKGHRWRNRLFLRIVRWQTQAEPPGVLKTLRLADALAWDVPEDFRGGVTPLVKFGYRMPPGL